MIAKVYLITRLPRDKGAFDYQIPEGLSVKRGAFVTVPFRGSARWGVVKELTDKPIRGIKLKSIGAVHEKCFLREDELSFFEHLAQELAQSVSSVLLAGIPTPPKRSGQSPQSWKSAKSLTLPRSETEALIRTVRAMRGRREAFIATPDIRRSAAVLAAFRTAEPNEKLLIIAPTVREVELLKPYFDNVITVTGEMTNNQRYRAWELFKSSENPIMIGTKVVSLLLDESVTTIAVIHPSDQSHKQFDRNPRFDARTVAWDLHNMFHSNLFYFDSILRSVDAWRFPEVNRLTWSEPIRTQIVDLGAEKRNSSHKHLSLSAENAIAHVLSSGGRVLCFLNRKGRAARLLCSECSHKVSCLECGFAVAQMEHVVRCPNCMRTQASPSRCPNCKSAQIQEVGIGIESLKELFEHQFKGAIVQTCSKDQANYSEQHHILIATSFYNHEYFNPFKPDYYSLVLMIDADQALYSAGLHATESAVKHVIDTRAIASAMQASYLIQTHEPELFSSAIADANSLEESQIEILRQYNLPPFKRWFHVHLKEQELRKAELSLHQLRQELERIETVSLQKTSQTPEGLEFKGSISPEYMESVLKIFTQLPDRYIIDTSLYL